MNKEVIELLKKLDSYGGNSYLVGGAVRDYLSGIESFDYDVTTSLLPDEVLEVFKDYKCNDKFKSLGNVIVYFNTITAEITTFRKEFNYLDKRHPNNVLYTNSLEEDLVRRDFTINALAMDKDLKIYDYHNGLIDLRNNKLRTIGNPKMRILEDNLRILRALRFVSKYNYDVEEQLNEVLLNDDIVSNIKSLSKEKIGKELLSIIDGKYFINVLNNYQNVLKYTLKAFENIKNVDLCPIFKANSLDFKLAILYFNNEPFLEELNLISVGVKRVNLLRKWILGVKILKNSKNEGKKRAIFQKSSIITNKDDLKNIINLYKIIYNEDLNYLLDECLFTSDLVVNGNDLLSFGIKKEKINIIFNDILCLIVNNKLNNSYSEIKTFVINKYL